MRIASWNVNGIRPTLHRGELGGWLEASRPDVVGFQEVKALPEQVDGDVWERAGYRAWWHPADKPGYSGALLLSRVEPRHVQPGLGVPEIDREGRVIRADFEAFTLLTAYFPNSGRRGARLDFKESFCRNFLDVVNGLRMEGRPVVFMGDLNIAHREIDLARPDQNRGAAGWLPEERAWMDRFLDAGWVDTFRSRNPDREGAYTYWEPWREHRARNIGWRIDYVMVDRATDLRVTDAFIEAEVMG
ncbi:MAG: exodeoxyribonuclease III, partial [Dehalococcoidia bacterium]